MDNRAVVVSLYAAFAARDEAAILALLDEHFTVTQTELLPWGGVYEGAEGFRQFMRRLLGTVDSRVDVEEYFEAGESIVALGRTAGHVRANGAAFDVRIAHIWTVRDGRALRFAAYIDTPAMLKALGRRA